MSDYSKQIFDKKVEIKILKEDYENAMKDNEAMPRVLFILVSR